LPITSSMKVTIKGLVKFGQPKKLVSNS
jgi:hypothetical protein